MNDGPMQPSSQMITRRRLIGFGAAMMSLPVSAGLAEVGKWPASPSAKPLLSIDDLVPFGTAIDRSEGVVIDRDGQLFSAGRNGVVYATDPEGRTRVVTRLPSNSVPNGLTMDRHGNIICCDLGLKAVLRIDQDGKTTVIAEEAGGIKLVTPNFPTFDAEGNLFISISTANGLDRIMSEFETPVPAGALVRIRPNGKSDMVADGLYLANGTAINPDVTP